MRTTIVLFLLCLTGCQAAVEWYDIATSRAMQVELRNGAIVREEMRARGEAPW